MPLEYQGAGPNKHCLFLLGPFLLIIPHVLDQLHQEPQEINSFSTTCHHLVVRMLVLADGADAEEGHGH